MYCQYHDRGIVDTATIASERPKKVPLTEQQQHDGDFRSQRDQSEPPNMKRLVSDASLEDTILLVKIAHVFVV